MNILYTSYTCSQQYFQNMFNTAIVKPAQAPQKFHHLMVTGLKENDVNVTCLVGRPITVRSHKQKLWTGFTEVLDNVKYVYIPCINNPFAKRIIYFVYSFFYSLWWSIKNKKYGAIVTDILCGPVTKGSALAARIVGIPVNGIVTDLPDMLNFNANKISLAKSIDKALSIDPFNLCTQYTPLTIQMCDVMNPKNKPFVIVEGLVDSEMKFVERIESSDGKRHICYTGQIYEQFGVKNLIEAFMQVKAEDVVLDIYGPGPMADEMHAYMAKDHRIIYHGCVPMEEAVCAQLRAYLLVNPRPTHEVFTKYSFPSKNMEYMVSGAPMLTTILPGMPVEYHNHVFLFHEESVEGMVKTIREILQLPKNVVISKGEDGKNFVLREKNNIIQARKIMDLIMRESMDKKY